MSGLQDLIIKDEVKTGFIILLFHVLDPPNCEGLKNGPECDGENTHNQPSPIKNKQTTITITIFFIIN